MLKTPTEHTYTVNGEEDPDSAIDDRVRSRRRRGRRLAEGIVTRSRSLQAHRITPIHLTFQSSDSTRPHTNPEDLYQSQTLGGNSTWSGGEKPRGRRGKRAADSWDHYVEVLVVADYKMLVYHQGNLENYLLTLFSTVASIYRHPTLGASINIVVVRVVILKHEKVSGVRVRANLQNYKF